MLAFSSSFSSVAGAAAAPPAAAAAGAAPPDATAPPEGTEESLAEPAAINYGFNLTEFSLNKVNARRVPR